MSLEFVINFIKNLNEKNIKFKQHSKDRIVLRNLSIETIRHYILNERIVGLHQQNNNIYKIWYAFNTKEDLSIVAKIEDPSFKIITVFKENNFKRIKNGKK